MPRCDECYEYFDETDLIDCICGAEVCEDCYTEKNHDEHDAEVFDENA